MGWSFSLTFLVLAEMRRKGGSVEDDGVGVVLLSKEEEDRRGFGWGNVQARKEQNRGFISLPSTTLPLPLVFVMTQKPICHSSM